MNFQFFCKLIGPTKTWNLIQVNKICKVEIKVEILILLSIMNTLATQCYWDLTPLTLCPSYSNIAHESIEKTLKWKNLELTANLLLFTKLTCCLVTVLLLAALLEAWAWPGASRGSHLMLQPSNEEKKSGIKHLEMKSRIS